MDGCGLYELIVLVPRVGLLKTLSSRGRSERGLTARQQVPGEGDAIPVLVSVHGEVPADERCDAAAIELLEERFEASDRRAGASRWRITAIEKSVQQDAGRAAGRRRADNGGNMVFVAVDTARGKQAHDVQRAAGGDGCIDRTDQLGILRKLTGLDIAIDARQFLEHDSPGTKVHVSDLGIAHLSAGQADVEARARDQRVRCIAPKGIPDRRVGGGDGVVFRFFPMAEASRMIRA